MKAIDQAISKLAPPNQAELARQLNVTPQQVNKWVKRGWAAPKYAPAIERLTGVSCSALVEDMQDNEG